ncbi:MAG: glycerophosphodiester phosphodiesterase [Bacillota bacterium]
MNAIRIAAACMALLVGWSAQAQEKGLVFAHRGGAGEFDENTLAAFKGSYEKGLRGFETDIRMTRDGVLAILHDDALQRMYNSAGRLEEMTASELRQFKTKKSGQPFLFLDELLAYFADKPGVYLEFEMKTGNTKTYPDAKLEEYCQKLYDAVMAKHPKGSIYVFTSFDKRPLKILKRLHPDADLMLISDGPCNDQVMQQAKELGVKRVGCRIEGTSRTAVQTAHKAGLKVTGWPGKSLEDYLLGLGLGLDAICTDIPVAIHTWKTENLKPLPPQTPGK